MNRSVFLSHLPKPFTVAAAYLLGQPGHSDSRRARNSDSGPCLIPGGGGGGGGGGLRSVCVARENVTLRRVSFAL